MSNAWPLRPAPTPIAGSTLALLLHRRAEVIGGATEKSDDACDAQKPSICLTGDQLLSDERLGRGRHRLRIAKLLTLRLQGDERGTASSKVSTTSLARSGHVSAGANRSENVATLASRAAASEAEIRALNPKVATASKRVEKTRLRIPPSFKVHYTVTMEWLCFGTASCGQKKVSLNAL